MIKKQLCCLTFMQIDMTPSNMWIMETFRVKVTFKREFWANESAITAADAGFMFFKSFKSEKQKRNPSSI